MRVAFRIGNHFGFSDRAAKDFRGACSPAYDYGFDALASFHVLPITATPSTQEVNYICADVILTKKLK